MKRLLFFVALTAMACSPATLLWAAPVIDSVASNATRLEVNVPTPVTITAVISDPGYLQGSANLQRQGVNGTWTVLGSLQNVGGGQYRIERTFTEPTGGTMRLRVSAAFRGVLKRALSAELLLPVDLIVQPSANEQVIHGPAGTGLTLTIPPNALTEPALVGIAPTSGFPAPTGALPVIAILDILVRPLDSSRGDGQLLIKPLQLSLPAPAGTSSGDRFYVAQPLFTGSEQKLLAIDTATMVGGQIVTQGTNLAGIFGGGPTVILKEVGSGYAEGTLPLSSFGGSAPGPRPGVFVTNSTNPFAFLSDANGHFKLPITGSPPDTFTVTAIDPVTCDGHRSLSVVRPINDDVKSVNDFPLNRNISITFFESLRLGFLNGGFEKPPGCAELFAPFDVGRPPLVTGGRSQGFGPFLPVEGQFFLSVECQASLSLPDPDPEAPSGCGLTQRFKVPRGVGSLKFHYNGDPSVPFTIRISPIFGGGPLSDPIILSRQTSASTSGVWFSEVIDFSRYPPLIDPGTNEVVDHVIDFTVSPQPVNFFGSPRRRVLIDNIHFGTVVVDVKILQGAMDDLADDAARFERVRQQVRDANEILAQSGVNVQIRRIQIIPAPGLFETDMTAIAINQSSGLPEVPTEVAQLLALERSFCLVGEFPVDFCSADVNVYYVGALKNGTDTLYTYGLAVGPDDYHMTNPAIQRGVILRNLFGADLNGILPDTDRRDRFREGLAHELGHLLIHGKQQGDVLEHSADPGNIMRGGTCTLVGQDPNTPAPFTRPCSARTIMTPEQSAIINQNGSGLIVQ